VWITPAEPARHRARLTRSANHFADPQPERAAIDRFKIVITQAARAPTGPPRQQLNASTSPPSLRGFILPNRAGERFSYNPDSRWARKRHYDPIGLACH
jgi:hypothetical protein